MEIPRCPLKSKLFCLSAGLVVLVIVAVTSFLFGRASVRSLSVDQISPTPTTAIPTPDPTADWKTYTNSKYQYSFKYPNDWLLFTEGESEVLTNPITKGEGLGDKIEIEFGKILDIRLNVLTLDEWYEQYRRQRPAELVVSHEKTTVGGNEAIKATHDYGFTAYYIQHESSVFHIDVVGDKNSRKYFVVDQILSTFRFLD